MTGPTWPGLLTVHVTAGDIAAGEPQTCATCPVALAARRALGAPVEVGYSLIEAYACPGEEDAPAAAWALPAAAQDFIVRFDDDDCPVEPITFTAERVA